MTISMACPACSITPGRLASRDPLAGGLETVVAWILSSDHQLYVAAVFGDAEAAARYLAKLPAPVRGRSSLASRADLALPCYLVEDAAGLRPMSESEARSYVAGLARQTPGADCVYGTLYRLDCEFLPDVAGRDEMGSLPHVHLGERDLAVVERAGVATLFEADAPGI